MAAMRSGIRDFEKAELVEALKAGKTWDEAKEILPDVDPKVLDEGFKEWAHKEAGIKVATEEGDVAAEEKPKGKKAKA